MARNIENIYPLSALQRGMLFHSLYEPKLALYYQSFSSRIEVDLDVDRFQLAWRLTVERHSALRTAFVWKNRDEPLQIAFRNVPLPWRVEDWRGVAPEEQKTRLAELLEQDQAEGFDLGKPPLMRFMLIRLADEQYHFVWSSHHLLFDGWSVPLIFQDVADFYQGAEKPAARPYGDYIAWLGTRDSGAAERFWRERLKGFAWPTKLPVSAPAAVGDRVADAFGEQELSLSSAATAELLAFARRHHLTLSTILQGMWALLLSRHSGERDVVYGWTVFGRPADLESSESMVGMFINTLPMRVDVAPEERVLPWLRKLQLAELETRDYDYAPLVDIQGWSDLARGQKFFDSLMALTSSVGEKPEQVEGLGMGEITTVQRASTPLVLRSKPAEALAIAIDYDRRLFDDATIARMIEQMKSIVTGMVRDPEQRLGDLSLVGESERQLLLADWNATGEGVPNDRCIHELFEQQAARRPDAIALIQGDEIVRYGELNERANRLAHHLRALGVKREERVGICVERTPRMVEGLLAILKAGAAYLPLDPSNPVDRLQFMLEDASVRVVLSEASVRERIDGLSGACRVVDLDRERAAIAAHSAANPATGVTAENLAYVVYTSGSTGEPKGTEVPHRSLTGFMFGVSYATFDEQQVLLQHSSVSWDALTLELWPALAHGGHCVLYAGRVITPEELGELVERHGISVLWLTSSVFTAVMETRPEVLRGVRQLLTGGEALSVPHVRRALAELPGTRIVNGYGPSECTVFSTCHVPSRELPEGAASIPIGRPVGDRRVYLLDERMDLVPVGVVGEIHVGGPGVGRGYLQRPALTAERFVPDPFGGEPGARLYRTGDLARWTADGVLEFVGRRDHQVKVRGFRIELGEIEAVLGRHEQIRECALKVWEDGEKRLVAYVVAYEGTGLTADDVRAYLKERVPEYMVPSIVEMLDAMPLTANGKVDRRALPEPKREVRESGDAPAAPRTPLEELIASIWCEVLDLERVGIHDSFFDLGGHSLSAMKIVSRIRKSLQVDLPIRTLFQTPTIAAIADAISGETVEPGFEPPPIVPVPREEGLMLSFAQERLWFLNRLTPDTANYNVPVVYRVDGNVDEPALARALNELVARHEILRTTFPQSHGKPFARIHPAAPRAVSFEAVASAEAAQKIIDAEVRRPFDLAAGPLLRFTGLRAGGHTYLAFVFHHIVIDGWSLETFLRELGTLYDAFRRGEESPLEALSLQYADYAAWQRKWLHGETLERQLAYWRTKLADAPPRLLLPLDRPHPAVTTFNGNVASLRLPVALVSELESLSRRHDATLFLTFLSAFQVLLAKYSGQNDILVGAPIANRRWLEAESMIGFFVNTFVLRGDLSGDPAFTDFLTQMRRTVMEAQAHQDVPFEKLVQELRPEADLSQSPIFQVLFTFQNAEGNAFRLGGARTELIGGESGTAKFDMTLGVVRDAEGVLCEIEYATDLFDARTIEAALRHYAVLLTNIAARPEAAVSTLRLLDDEERRSILFDLNGTASPVTPACIHELFEQQAARTPDEIAIRFETRAITYRELDERANRLAHYLIAQGVGPEHRVGIYMRRTPDIVVSLLAVLKAGGAYVPLDPEYPHDRLVDTVADAGMTRILSQTSLLDRLRETGVPAICLDRDAAEIDRHPSTSPGSIAIPENLAYIIYTSGSTGRPKGVSIEHRQTVSFLHWSAKTFSLEEYRGMLASTSICFDIAVYEIFSTLTAGGTVILVENVLHLPTIPAASEVRVINTVPSAMTSLLKGKLELPKLMTVNLAGEPLQQSLVEASYALPGVQRVFNFYGPTEDTTYSTALVAPRKSDRQPTLGHSLLNKRAYILDPTGEPVPMGIRGEIFVGGEGVTRGYLGRPDMTADRYSPDPFSGIPGSRIYRTGDIGRWLPDGSMEFFGRVDHQVKIRGFRIELAEIENVLRLHPTLAEAIVMVDDDPHVGKRLVAYVVARDGQTASVADLREHAKAKLAPYMVPGAWVVLPAMPLTPNGKIDRKALPAPAPAEAAPKEAVVTAMPDSALEREVVAIWKELLQVDDVGLDDSFFDVGGHSLLLADLQFKLKERLDLDVPLLEIFRYPTVRMLVEAFAPRSEAVVPQTPARRERTTVRAAGHDIAVIGLSGRFPGAPDVEQLWSNLRDGVESVRFFTEEELAATVPPELLSDPNYVKALAILDDIDQFDAGFFGVNPREAQVMDPQHRVFLEQAWNALETAGYDSTRYDGAIGVFAGAGASAYAFNLASHPELLATTGTFAATVLTDGSSLPTRTSYALDLKGPSVFVSTACSTSLVAIHLACQSLRAGESDMALAGGVSVTPIKVGYLYQEDAYLSPDGHCRAFDAQGRGTVGGSGAGVVVLKRLEDAIADGDTIRAIIRGSAINNDGAGKIGFTAPSIQGQAAVIGDALADAGVPAESISYVEAHGTGTTLGDPIEVAGLTQAYRAQTDKTGFCAIGSVKTNFGHTDTAAGVAGFIKTVLSLEHGQIPPNLNFTAPNPAIDFANSTFFVNAQLRPWQQVDGVRRAGVSSFGIGGTNAHVILEEAEQEPGGATRRDHQLLVLSARSAEALDRAAERLAQHLTDSDQPLADVAYTLQMGRRAFRHRRAVVGRDREDAVRSLQSEQRIAGTAMDRPEVVFLFPGGGTQYVNMGRDLYESEPLFRAQMDECAEILEPVLGLNLLSVLYPHSAGVHAAREALQRTSLALPALFAVELSMARLLESWGIRPQSMIGHSLGEYVAACIAGVMSVRDALSIVAVRGQLIEGVPSGSMLSIPLPEDEVRRLIEGTPLSLAALNAPGHCLVSGATGDVDRMERTLVERGLEIRRLPIAAAGHSALVEPIIEPFLAAMRRIAMQAPSIPYVSNVTGRWITPEEATSPEYWARHLRNTVRFADGIGSLMDGRARVFIEVGPGQTLATLARQCAEARAVSVEAITTMRHPQHQKSDVATLLAAIGKLWTAGVEIDWKESWSGETRRRVPLPTYPFERKSYWVEFHTGVTPAPVAAKLEKKKDLADWFYTDSWTRQELPGGDRAASGDWLILPDQLGIGSRLAERLGNAGDRPHAGVVSFHGLGASEADWTSLLERIESMDGGELVLVTRGMHEVIGGEALDPYNAAFVDMACRAAERAGVRCRTIDVVPNDVNRLAEQLFAELAQPAAPSDVALRGSFRWTHTHAPVRLGAATPRRGGHYVIVGDPDAALLVEQCVSRLEPASIRVLASEDDVQRVDWLVYAPAPAGEPAAQLREAVELSSLVDRLRPAHVMTFARGPVSRYLETLGRMKQWCGLRLAGDIPVEDVPELFHRGMVFGRSVVVCPVDLDELLRRGELAPAAAVREQAVENNAASVDDVETALRVIWQEQLGIDRIGVHDNFFELGGTSLNGIQIVAAARRKGLHFTSKQLFEHQTVASLLQAVTVMGAPVPETIPQPSADTTRESVTPADFRKVQLSQAELDGIMASLLGDAEEEALSDVQ